MRTMRRQDRAIAKEEALRLLEQGEYGVLSTVGPESQPYGVPVSFCVIGDSIYFHSAVEGHKIDALQAPHQELALPGGEAAHFRRACCRCISRINKIDVES